MSVDLLSTLDLCHLYPKFLSPMHFVIHYRAIVSYSIDFKVHGMVWDLPITTHFLCITSMGLSKDFCMRRARTIERRAWIITANQVARERDS